MPNSTNFENPNIFVKPDSFKLSQSDLFQKTPLQNWKFDSTKKIRKSNTDENLESWEKTKYVRIPRCAFLITECTCKFLEFNITIPPSIVPLLFVYRKTKRIGVCVEKDEK